MEYELNSPGGVTFTSRTKVFSQVLFNCSKADLNGVKTGVSFWGQTKLILVIDTGSSHHIINNRSVFVGALKLVHNLFLNGIGSQIKAEGYGTVKLRVFDDNGQLHHLVIHDVLYVPDSPANLLSPQKLTSGRPSSECNSAFTITSGDTTVLIWDNGRFQRTITHCKGIADIPLLQVNDDFNAGDALFCEPCSLLSSYQLTPSYLHSSKSIKVQEGVVSASEGVRHFEMQF
jgi:Retroviral aspartyl protease.